MFDAQTIQMYGATSTVVYSPWFPRGGDYGLFTVEAAKMSDAVSTFTLKVEMVHKNASDPGDGGNPISGSDFSIAGNATGAGLRATKDVTAGFKELVRYKFTLAHTGSPGSTTTNFAIFRMLAPVWYDKV